MTGVSRLLLPVGDGQLDVRIAGRGPALVFLHGFSVDQRSWEPQVRSLSGAFTCITYDLRGFGDSSLPTDDYDHSDDLAAVLGRLAPDGAIIVGLSLGANIALSCAGRHPERLRGLVLASSGLAGHDWGRAERPPAAAERIAREAGVEAARTFWLAHPLFASLDDHPAARRAVRRMIADYSGWHWAAPGRVAKIAAPPPLDAVRVPTLVLSGGRDVTGYRQIAANLADGIPGARLVHLPDAGHMMNLECPEDFDRHLRSFAGTCLEEGKG